MEYLTEFSRVIKRPFEDYFLIEVYSSSMNRIINVKANMDKRVNDIYLRPETNIIAYEKNKKAHLMKNISDKFDGPVKKGMIIDYLREVRDDKVKYRGI